MSLKTCIVGYGRAGRLQHQAAENVLDVVSVVDERTSVENMLSGHAQYNSNLMSVMEDPSIQIVVICTPTFTHYKVCRIALEHGKHVFLEKPIASTTSEIEHLYELARKNNRLLFVAFNRRYDDEWNRVVTEVQHGIPFHVNVVCRDHPFPPAAYLETCGGIFRDAAVHDLDMLCLMLEDTPTEVDARLDDRKENGSINLTFSNGCRATLIHSRHSTGYDQRVSVVMENKMIEMLRPVQEGETFQARYQDSYRAQMMDFSTRITNRNFNPNISQSHALMLERIVDACDESAGNSQPVYLKTLREYETAQKNVKDLYRTARTFHTFEKSKYLRDKYCANSHTTLSVEQTLQEISRFVDLSDPDLTLPNDQHALQTAESIRHAGLPDWMQVVGLIHDLGKILFLWGCDEDGTTLSTQWSIVGDTFIVGYPLPNEIVYPEFNKTASDAQKNMYNSQCGLDQCIVSFGHDEYLYQVLLASDTKLPKEALKVIRYHSLYAWHEGGAYSDLENEEDRLVKGWVKLFNQHDLYSKRKRFVNKNSVWNYYKKLCDKYIPNGLRF